ncbi:MAG TPA: DmsE family decaheme c-type cytochrome [Thermoanaerobaculia bacterium]|nr:DmsE family decaheme c-type cytochrome [Thermoanaerobaculia bacterium]
MRSLVKTLALIALFLFLTGAARAPREVDWVALNPAFKDATFVKDTSTCLGCHEDAMKKYEHTTHARTFKAAARTELDKLGCEACHGPRSKHIEEPTSDLSLDRISPDGRSQICLQCHRAGKNQMHWQASAHSGGAVSCDSCHMVMERRSDLALLKTKEQESLCYDCHADVRAQMQKSSHHPVREGKMTCSNCHNPHGSTGPTMLRRATVTETCQSCHQDKRGPFVWEHPPARDNCATCHNAHGSNNRSMLVNKAQFLCLQCHSYGGHINVPRYNRTSAPTQQGCVNCHVTPHGSNHPSGAKLTR